MDTLFPISIKRRSNVLLLKISIPTFFDFFEEVGKLLTGNIVSFRLFILPFSPFHREIAQRTRKHLNKKVARATRKVAN